MPELIRPAIEAACLAVYAQQPSSGTPEQDVEWGLSYIYDGAKVWPGNGRPITDAERNSFLAGLAIERLGYLIVGRDEDGDYYRQQHPELHNPYLDQAIEVVDTIIPAELFDEDNQEVAGALFEELEGIHWADALPHLVRAARAIRVEAPTELQFYFDILRKSKEVLTARGTVTQDAFFFDEIEAGADKMDTSVLAPEFIEIDEDGNMHEPAVYSVLSLVEQTGAVARPHDFPYYHTWDTHHNSVEVLNALLEDIAQIHAEVSIDSN